MRKILLFAACLFSISTGMFAQVTLYAAPDFKGVSLKMYEGSISSMSSTIIGNDRLGSVIVPSGYRVTMYEHDNFLGYAESVSYSSINLPSSLIGKVSSLVVTRDNGNGWVGSEAYGQPGWNNKNVVIFSECYYAGASNQMLPTNYPTMPANFNRRLSSILIPSGFEVDIFTQPNYEGRMIRLRSDQPCVPAEWNNVVASMKVYKNSSAYLPPNNYNPWTQNDLYNPANTNVILYDKCNYTGTQLPLANGEYPILPNSIKQKIFSIKIPAGKEVILYSGMSFTGSSYRLVSNKDCMSGNLEFYVSSIKIQQSTQSGNSQNGWPANGAPVRPMPTAVQKEVQVYNECYYKGKTNVYKPGNYPFLISSFNNDISSIQVPSNRRVILYTGINYTGHSYILTKDNQCLNGAFNNRIRSAIVEAY